MGPVKIMAKDLVRTRTYITKFIELRSHLNAVALKLQTVKSQEAMARAMKSVARGVVRTVQLGHALTGSTPAQVTEAMVRMNKTVNIPSIQKIMVNFQVENERAEMTQEVMGDMLDDCGRKTATATRRRRSLGPCSDEIGISFGDGRSRTRRTRWRARPQQAPVAAVDAVGGGAAAGRRRPAGRRLLVRVERGAAEQPAAAPAVNTVAAAPEGEVP